MIPYVVTAQASVVTRLAMSRRLQALNVVLAIVSIALAAGIVRTLIVRRALPTPAAPRTATVSAPAPATENVDPGLSGYAARRDASSSKKRSTARPSIFHINRDTTAPPRLFEKLPLSLLRRSQEHTS